MLAHSRHNDWCVLQVQKGCQLSRVALVLDTLNGRSETDTCISDEGEAEISCEAQASTAAESHGEQLDN